MTATLRRLPVPVSEPYPCSPPPRQRMVAESQGALALAFSTVAEPVPAQERWAAPQPTSSRGLPDPQTTCTALVQAVIEVLAGTRQVGQLVRWLSADVYVALQRRAALHARVRHPRAGTPQVRRPVVTGVRTCCPVDGVVEASAVVLDRGRVRAVAVRLEGLDGRWRATALEIG